MSLDIAESAAPKKKSHFGGYAHPLEKLLDLEIETQIFVRDRQTKRKRFDELFYKTRQGIIERHKFMRLISLVASEKFVSSVAAQDNLHVLRSKMREQKERQNRRIRQRLIEDFRQPFHNVQHFLRAKDLEVMFDSQGARDLLRISAFVEGRFLKADAETLQVFFCSSRHRGNHVGIGSCDVRESYGRG